MNDAQRRKFFEDLAIESGVIDVEGVRRIYYSLVRLTVRNTRKLGKYQLPDLGEFKMNTRRARRQLVYSKREVRMVGETKMFIFKADYKIRNLINDRELVHGRTGEQLEKRVKDYL